MKRHTIDDLLLRIEKTETCWVWRGPLHLGYGMISFGGRTVRAHRLIYEHYVGPIPNGLHIDHLCRNRACVNPAHLEAVTNKENILRGVGITAQNARKTECKRGHPFTEENILRTHRGGRECRLCHEAKYKDLRSTARRSPLHPDCVDAVRLLAILGADATMLGTTFGVRAYAIRRMVSEPPKRKKRAALMEEPTG